MASNESQFAENIQTLRDKCGENVITGDNIDTCNKAFQEAMDFMKQPGSVQTQLQERGLVKLEGNSLSFSTNIYPSEKSEKR